ncbi:Thiopurine S-methyltransferase [Trichoplax sp. H2]|nr:Thiopurine S-methyltransferase [Trichoplax sp. H2]|eukprot:RDD42373.1 Thiopurine S-methyltransferase [Trichoplax sp. H2]
MYAISSHICRKAERVGGRLRYLILGALTRSTYRIDRLKMSENRQTYEDYAQKGHYNHQDWSQRWQNQTTKWHVEEANHHLVENYETHLQDKDNPHSSIFVPLCGKSLDMIWLAQKGHQVVGVEVVEQPCHDFFQENKIEYKVQNLQGVEGKVLTSQVTEMNITIYNCDYFALTPKLLGYRFDSVWDRAAFVAINPDLRCDYAKHLASLMAPSGRGLLVSLNYDINERIHPGPPFCTPDALVQSVFSPLALVQKLSSTLLTGQRIERFHLSYMDENINYLKFNKE